MKKHEFHIAYHSFSEPAELNVDDQTLIVAAIEATKRAYAPYSGFHVGAAIRLTDGNVVTGSNQENSAYPSGLCAERVALFRVGSDHPEAEIDTLVVTARSPGKLLSEIVKPCGACRQVMLESANRQSRPFRIILISELGEGLIFDSIKELLPFSFSF